MALCDIHGMAILDKKGWSEKESSPEMDCKEQQVNPVIESAKFIYKHTDLVKINEEGVKAAARHIYTSIANENYSPHTWRDQPLHFQPPRSFSFDDPRTKACLDWIFLVSSLNFSFWSVKEGTVEEAQRFGVEWREGWRRKERKIWTGYWSLVASINKGLEANIPITDPLFYASKTVCPDRVLKKIFQPATECSETIPLINERISVMREVGTILVSKFGGSYAGLLSHFIAKHGNERTALQLVRMVVEEFPAFRDEALLEGRKVYFWKRAQILVAETWAAFYPSRNSANSHPFFPRGIGQLTMFADYRVPQILHHLRIMSYTPSLLSLLKSRALMTPGCQPEMSIRGVSILAVEAVREEITRLRHERDIGIGGRLEGSIQSHEEFPSVMIDFFLWDLAKKVERGDERIEGIETSEMVPAHRTRSIWY